MVRGGRYSFSSSVEFSCSIRRPKWESNVKKRANEFADFSRRAKRVRTITGAMVLRSARASRLRRHDTQCGSVHRATKLINLHDPLFASIDGYETRERSSCELPVDSLFSKFSVLSFIEIYAIRWTWTREPKQLARKWRAIFRFDERTDSLATIKDYRRVALSSFLSTFL